MQMIPITIAVMILTELSKKIIPKIIEWIEMILKEIEKDAEEMAKRDIGKREKKEI